MSPDGSISVRSLWKGFPADKQRLLARDRLRLGSRRGKPGLRWVLRDITFDIEPGESVALLGVNGSGKSTLLKMLTGVMYPFAGSLDVRGRIGALIEVSSGIHPDLTGRENVLVYGSLLGWSRKAVSAHLDEIVAFAELEDAVDRRVKYYSSGMKTRLGFSIAAFLEPHVLLIDEVLAVGDAEFQHKCLNRMREVLSSGTTVVFVSHDLGAVQAVCTRGLWLSTGRLRADGPVDVVLAQYRTLFELSAEAAAASGEDFVVRVVGEAPSAVSGQSVRMTVAIAAARASEARLVMGPTDGTATAAFFATARISLDEGVNYFDVQLDQVPLSAGHYYLWGALATPEQVLMTEWRPIGDFHVSGLAAAPLPRGLIRPVPIAVETRVTRCEAPATLP